MVPQLKMLRVELRRPKRIIANILESDRHRLSRSVDCDMSKELQPVGGTARKGGPSTSAFRKHDFRAEGFIDLAYIAVAGVDRTRNKLPERFKVLESRSVRMEVMRRSVMYIRREPNRIHDPSVFDE